jgi:hypothetical protein
MPNVLRRAAVAVAAAAVLTMAVSVPAAHANTIKTAAESCDNSPIVFGLHGVNEGPSSTITTVSPTLQSFDSDLKDDSGGKLALSRVPYPTVYTNQWGSMASMLAVLNIGEADLQADINAYINRTCSQDRKIALVGFSFGAWIINDWMMNHKSEWGDIKAVTLFGDPCWRSGLTNEGLVRLFGFGIECTPSLLYPYPSAHTPFKVVSYSLKLDPVSGESWNGAANTAFKAAQLAAALVCKPAGKVCPHLDYPGTPTVNDGAELVVSKI